MVAWTNWSKSGNLRKRNDKVTPEGLSGRMLLQFAQATGSPSCQKRQETQLARLQCFVRIKQRFQVLRVRRDQTGFLILCPARLAAQFFDVEFDSLPRPLNRAFQRGIQLLDLLPELRQHLGDLFS